MGRRPKKPRGRSLRGPLVSAVLVFLVANGCGSDDDGSGAGPAPDERPSAASDEVPDPAPTEGPGEGFAVLFSDEEGGSFLDVDPTGTRVVRDGTGPEGEPPLLVRDGDEGPFTPFLAGDVSLPATQPKWVDDGRVVFITRTEDGDDDVLAEARLAVAAADGSSVRIIEESAGPYEDIYALAGVTGDVVYYVRYFGHPRGAALVSLHLDGTGLERVMPYRNEDHDNSFRLSPDGTRIAWSTSVDDGFRVMVAESDGSGAVEVAEGSSPVWSPEGDRLAYLTEVEPTNDEEFGLKQLMVVAADGSGEPEAVPGRHCCWLGPLAWLPDDRVLVSDDSLVVGEGRLYTLDVG